MNTSAKKILVPVKQVADPSVALRVAADGSGVELANVRMTVNPFDAIALEEALRLREAGFAAEVVVLSAGPAKAAEALRTCLAMGADRAILVETAGRLEPLAVAKIIEKIVREEHAYLVLLGKQAIDDDAGQTGQMLAARLGWPQATGASRLTMGDSEVVVVREVDDGLETLVLQLPAVVTVDLRLNEPRYASLPNIMKAKSKPLARQTPEALGVDVAPRLDVLRVEPPPRRQAGRRLASVEELVAVLKSRDLVP